MSQARVSTRPVRATPKRIRSAQPVTLPTFAFYGRASVTFRDGALVIGQPGKRFS